MPLLSRQATKLSTRLDLRQLTQRPREALDFICEPIFAGAQVMLDTGVYIHQLKGKAPLELDNLLRVRLVNHSVIAVQEMLHTVGVLDPADARTKANVAAIRDLLDAIPPHRLFTPTQDVMCDAAVYAGVLCRLQGYAKDRRMRAVHDCTLFFQARELGFTLITTNVTDFDLLLQMQPDGRVQFYQTV